MRAFPSDNIDLYNRKFFRTPYDMPPERVIVFWENKGRSYRIHNHEQGTGTWRITNTKIIPISTREAKNLLGDFFDQLPITFPPDI